MDLCDDDCDEEALRLAALRSLQKPKFINTHNLIPITTNPFSGVEDRRVKLEPISPSREQSFVDEKRIRLEKLEKESENKTEDDLLDDDDDSFEGLLNQLQATIDGTVKTKEDKKSEEEVEFLDVMTNKRVSSKEIIILESPPLSPRPTYRSRSRSRKISRSRSWSRSPRPRRYTPSRTPSPRYRRRRSKSWSPSPSRSPKNSFRPRSPYRSPRRWSRSPRRRRSRSPRARSPVPRKRSLSPRRSPRRRSRTRSPPRNRSRTPVNRARKRESPVRRRTPSPRRRHRPRRRSEDDNNKKKSEEKPSEPLDPVLEARRKKFESLPNANKKISLKAVKDTIEPVSETGLEIRLDALSDDSEDSDGQEGRFKSNSQPQTRGKLLSFRSIREGNPVVPPPRLEPVPSQPRYNKPERIRLKNPPQKREASPKVTVPAKVAKKPVEDVEKKMMAEVVSPVKKPEVGSISVKKDLFPSVKAPVVEEEPDLRSILAKKRKDRMGNANLLPLGSRLVQSALQHLGESKVKQPRRILVVDNSQQIPVQPPSRSVPKRRVRKVQDSEPISLLAEDSEPEEVIRPHKRKLKVKRSVTIASQVTN